MRRWLIRVALVVLPLALAVGGPAFIYSGVYNVAATRQHSIPVYWMLITTLRQSVFAQARDLRAPDMDLADVQARGLPLFDQHCVPCHGGPGVALAPMAMGMTPLPNNLVETARYWRTEEIYWVVRNGLKMTGMPAWEYRFDDRDLWAIAGFVKTLPGLSPAEYRELRDTVRPMPAHERSGDIP